MNKKRPMTEVVDEQKETHTRDCGWIKRPIPEVVDQLKETYDRGCG